MDDSTQSIIQIAFALFLIANPIGNVPAIINLIKDFDFEIQKKIMLRETLLALAIALFFQYLGTPFLNSLEIKKYTLSTCGGVLNLIVALNMIFPKPTSISTQTIKQVPILVPIATPLITGPGVMTNIMLFSAGKYTPLTLSSSILLAWVGVSIVLILAPYIYKTLGQRAMIAVEQLMGLMLAMMSVEMLVKGATLLLKSMN
jgi:multiple antibiotic resistance protein